MKNRTRVTAGGRNKTSCLHAAELSELLKGSESPKSCGTALVASEQRLLIGGSVSCDVRILMSSHLTPKEKRIIALVAQGLKNSDIAAIVGTTEFVVKNYLKAIFDKTGMWTRLELALWYVKGT